MYSHFGINLGHVSFGGAEGIRTPYLLTASLRLSQLPSVVEANLMVLSFSENPPMKLKWLLIFLMLCRPLAKC